MTTNANPITKPERAYTVTYNYNGSGAADENVTATYTYDGYKDGTTEMITKEGYITSEFTANKYTENKTLNVQWTGGDITTKNPIREGYTFEGWYKEEECTNKVADGNTSYSPTENITLYAKWIENNYTVNYYNGSSKLGSSDHVYGTAKNLTTMSELKGSDSIYTTFVGWATANNTVTVTHTDGKSVINLTSTAGETVNLYAVWKRTASFYSGNSETAITVDQFKNTSTYSVAAPAVTAINGWDTLGWRVDTNAQNESYGTAAAGEITENVGPTFYAVYSRTATFYSGLANGTTKTGTQYHNSGSDGIGTYKVTVPEAPAAITTANTEWTAIGWRADTNAENKTYNTTGEITANVGQTLYGIYSRTLTMAYNGNESTGGSTEGHTDTQYYNSNGSVSTVTFTTAANGFTRTGYEFSKWAEDSATGTQVEAGGTVTFAPAVETTELTKTMYVVWAPNTYTVSFNGIGSQNMNNWLNLNSDGYLYDAFSIEYDSNTNMNTIYCVDSGERTKIYYPIPTSVGTKYKLTFDYINPNGYTPLTGSNGIGYEVSNKVVDRLYEGNLTSENYLSTTKNTNAETIIYEFTATAEKTYITFDLGMESQDGILLGNFTIITSTATVTYNSAYGTLPTPTLFGYTFDGWYTGESGTGDKITNETILRTASDHTLYAKWTANLLTVNPNGGTYNNKTENTTIRQDDKLYYGLKTPTKNDYVFKNWTLSGVGNIIRGNGAGTASTYSSDIFTQTVKTDTDGSPYTNYKYNITPTSQTYPSLSYPNYSFTAGHTYRITAEVRLNAYTNIGTLNLRHACIGNDYSSTGRVATSIPASAVGQGWITYTMDRKWDGTTIASAKGQTNVTINPLFEIYTSVAANTNGIVDFDIKNVIIEDITNNTQISSSTYGGYIYKFGEGNATVTAGYEDAYYKTSNGTYHVGLQSAVNTVSNGGTITVLKAKNESGTITIGKSVTLDTNGKKIGGSYTLKPTTGTFTITGTGTLESSSDTIQPTGGTIKTTSGNKNSPIIKSTSAHAICAPWDSTATLNINGGLFLSYLDGTIDVGNHSSQLAKTNVNIANALIYNDTDYGNALCIGQYINVATINNSLIIGGGKDKYKDNASHTVYSRGKQVTFTGSSCIYTGPYGNHCVCAGAGTTQVGIILFAGNSSANNCATKGSAIAMIGSRSSGSYIQFNTTGYLYTKTWYVAYCSISSGANVYLSKGHLASGNTQYLAYNASNGSGKEKFANAGTTKSNCTFTTYTNYNASSTSKVSCYIKNYGL